MIQDVNKAYDEAVFEDAFRGAVKLSHDGKKVQEDIDFYAIEKALFSDHLFADTYKMWRILETKKKEFKKVLLPKLKIEDAVERASIAEFDTAGRTTIETNIGDVLKRVPGASLDDIKYAGKLYHYAADDIAQRFLGRKNPLIYSHVIVDNTYNQDMADEK